VKFNKITLKLAAMSIGENALTGVIVERSNKQINRGIIW
jgi:hypothetical protein